MENSSIEQKRSFKKVTSDRILNSPPDSSILLFIAAITLLSVSKPSVRSKVCAVIAYNGAYIIII